MEIMFYRKLTDPRRSEWRALLDLPNQSEMSDGETYDLVHTYRDMGFEVVVKVVELPK